MTDLNRLKDVPRELAEECLRVFLEGAPTPEWDRLQDELRAALDPPRLRTLAEIERAAGRIILDCINTEGEIYFSEHVQAQLIAMANEKTREPDPVLFDVIDIEAHATYDYHANMNRVRALAREALK